MKRTNVIFIALFITITFLIIYLIQKTGFNTLYAEGFKTDTWEKEVGPNMTKNEVRRLLGQPLSADQNTKCDFYSRPRMKWLRFKEYKVCYDGEEKFFLKLDYEYGFLPLLNDIY